MARRRLAMIVRLLSVSLLAAISVVTLPRVASAEVEEGVGHALTPGQSWGGRDRTDEHDWLGSYVLGDEQVFCVSFALKAPDTGETYEPGEELLDKWGEPLDPGHAANISYLLLRYGDTKDPDEAAALAHLLHSWTAAPRTPADLDPAKPFTEIAYDIESHFAKLPDGARDAVERLRAEARTYRGPWTAEISTPEAPQTIGAPAQWSVNVANTEGTGVPGVDITLALTELTPENGDADGDAAKTITVTTDENGVATAELAPNGKNPAIEATLSAPAERPYVREPVTTDTQRVVSTGGEQKLTTSAATTAKPAPGDVRVTKVDKDSGEGIAGVPLRLTGEDGTSPALSRDGQPLVDSAGEPVVLTTEGTDGVATAKGLATPQTVCVTEVRPPNGYSDAFDPANPPRACGTLEPGATLVLRIANVPDQVPRTIPAGARQVHVDHAATTSGAPVSALLALGGVAVAASALTGWAARRRFLQR